MNSLLFLLTILIYVSIHSKASNVGITTIVTPEVDFTSCFSCIGSNVTKVLDATSSIQFNKTCNGFVNSFGPYYYRLTFGSQTEIIKIENLTKFAAYLNGNALYIYFGNISNGTCAEDQIYGVEMDMTDDQKGCSSDIGVREERSLYAQLFINGKCMSKCEGKAVNYFKQAINNKGIIR